MDDKEKPSTHGPARADLAGADGAGAPVPAGVNIEFLAVLQVRGCPICEHLVRVSFDFFCRFQSDLSTQDHAQQQFAEEHGFCALHTWQLAAAMAPQDLSNALPLLAERTSVEIGRRAQLPDAAPDRLAARFLDHEQCRVCKLLREAEAEFTLHLAALVEQEVGQEGYARSQGVCLRHLDGLLAAASTEALRQFLLRHAARRLAELAEGMRAYALKHRTLHRSLASDDEKDAYRQALIHLVGDKHLCLPWTWGEVQW